MGKSTTDELVEAIAPKTKKQKKGTNMKRTILTIVATVVLTLAIVVAFVATFRMGVSHEANRQSEINARIETAVSEVAKLKK